MTHRTPVNVVCVATGDMIQNRARLALLSVAAGMLTAFMRIIYIGVEKRPPFQLLQTEYVQEYYVRARPGALLPFDELKRRGFMPCDLAIIGSPTHLHGRYVHQAQSIAKRVAVDKPLTPDAGEALSLVNYANVFPLSHFLAKQSLEPLWELDPREIDRIEFHFLQKEGVGPRLIDPAFHDIGFHQAAILLRLFDDARLVVDRCVTQTYEPPKNEPIPKETTAAEITGAVYRGETRIPFRMFMAKGSDRNRQEVIVRTRGGETSTVSQAGDKRKWAPYKRLLESLLVDERPRYLLPAARHVELVNFCEQAGSVAENAGMYPYGVNPFGPRAAADEAPDEQPADGGCIDHNPADHNPADRDPVDHNPLDGRPVDGGPLDGAPVDGRSDDRSPPASQEGTRS